MIRFFPPKNIFAILLLVSFCEAQEITKPNLTHIHSARNVEKKLTHVLIQALEKNKDKVYGIEILTTEQGLPLNSKFGHTAVRFLMNEKEPFFDTIVNFREDQNLKDGYDVMAGINGKNNLSLQSQTYFSYIMTYLMTENRNIRRSIVVTSREQRSDLIQALLDYEQNQNDKYKTLSNNCIQVWDKFFKRSKIAFSGYNPLIPLFARYWLASNLLSPFPEFSENPQLNSLNRGEFENGLLQLNSVSVARDLYSVENYATMTDDELKDNIQKSFPRMLGQLRISVLRGYCQYSFAYSCAEFAPHQREGTIPNTHGQHFLIYERLMRLIP